MLVEITWFIILPFIKELHYWIKQREQMRFNKNTLTTLSIILLLIVVIFIPWQSRIETPALLTVKEHTILFMPLAAKLNKIRVKEGQSVEKGQVLIQFSSTDLQSQIQQQKIKISALHRQISFHGQETHLNKNRQVLLSELANAESEYKSLEDEKKKLTITAPLSGSVLNINESLKQEQWFAKDEPLLMLAQFNKYQIEAYISEEYLEQIKSSNKAWFYPDNIEIQTIAAEITRIDNAAATTLKPEFSSRYSGNIAVQESRQSLIPQNAVYRVLLKPEPNGLLYPQTVRGNVMIDAKPQSLAGLVWKRVLSVLIRESGV